MDTHAHAALRSDRRAQHAHLSLLLHLRFTRRAKGKAVFFCFFFSTLAALFLHLSMFFFSFWPPREKKI